MKVIAIGGNVYSLDGWKHLGGEQIKMFWRQLCIRSI